jgi:hypothetical protein
MKFLLLIKHRHEKMWVMRNTIGIYVADAVSVKKLAALPVIFS